MQALRVIFCVVDLLNPGAGDADTEKAAGTIPIRLLS
jgi:hypothetical protein